MGIFKGGRDERKIQRDGGRREGSLRDSGGNQPLGRRGNKEAGKKGSLRQDPSIRAQRVTGGKARWGGALHAMPSPTQDDTRYASCYRLAPSLS